MIASAASKTSYSVPRGLEVLNPSRAGVCAFVAQTCLFALRNNDHAVAARHITARLGLNGDPSGFHLMHPSESRLWHHYIIDAWRTEFTS